MKEYTLKDFTAWKAFLVLFILSIFLSGIGAVVQISAGISDLGQTNPEKIAEGISHEIIEFATVAPFLLLTVYLAKVILKLTGGIKLSLERKDKETECSN